MARNPKRFRGLGRKFPVFPASFPASRANFAHFGQNLRFSGLRREKFPAKFPEAGNLRTAAFAQFGIAEAEFLGAVQRLACACDGRNRQGNPEQDFGS